MSVLKLTITGPAVLASAVLWLMAVALPPPVLGLVGFLGGCGLVVALVVGAVEEQAVSRLAGARAATAGERAVLAPILAALIRPHVPEPRLYVRRNPRPETPPAIVTAGVHLVVTPWLIEATYRGWISREEAAALVAHAQAAHRFDLPRCELAVRAFTLPYRAVLRVSRGVGRAAACFPFVKFAWRIRAVVGVVTVAQSIADGRAWAGLLGGGFIALTYLIPAATRERDRRVEAAADQEVVELDLGPVLAGLLGRFHIPVSLERMQRLHGPHRDAPAHDEPLAPRFSVN